MCDSIINKLYFYEKCHIYNKKDKDLYISFDLEYG